jgi:hypothetical protein
MSDDNIGMLRLWSKHIKDPMQKQVLLNSVIEILTLRKETRELRKTLKKKSTK